MVRCTSGRVGNPQRLRVCSGQGCAARCDAPACAVARAPAFARRRALVSLRARARISACPPRVPSAELLFRALIFRGRWPVLCIRLPCRPAVWRRGGRPDNCGKWRRNPFRVVAACVVAASCRAGCEASLSLHSGGPARAAVDCGALLRCARDDSHAAFLGMCFWVGFSPGRSPTAVALTAGRASGHHGLKGGPSLPRSSFGAREAQGGM